MKIPPPPDGFEIIGPAAPPPPPGFELIGPEAPAQSTSTPETNVNIETPESWGDLASGTALSAAQGLTFNFADELLAAIAGGAGFDREATLKAVRDKQKAFEERHPYLSTGAEITGSLGSGIGASVSALRALPRLANMAGVTGSMSRGAALGAPMSAAYEVGGTEGDESMTDAAMTGALTGGAFGATAGALGQGVRRLVRPWISDDAATLRNAGVRLTPGEMIGGYGKRMEDSLGSVPFLGAMVRNQQNQGVRSLNEVAMRQALAPDNVLSNRMNAVRPEVGHDMLDEATRQINARYAAIIPRMRADARDAQLITDLRRITQAVPHSRRIDFRDAISRHIDDSTDPTNNMITGRGMQNAIGGLRDEGTRLMTSQGSHAFDHDLGRAMHLARDALIAAAGRQTPARTMGDYRRLQHAYAGFARIRDAASRTGADQGVFTPAQLAAAVRGGDKSAGKGAFARGQALLQDLAGPAKAVMSRSVNDSGTPERAALMGAILAPQVALTGLMAGAPAALFYTNVGRRLFERLATGSPQTRDLIARIMEISGRSGVQPAIMRPLTHD